MEFSKRLKTFTDKGAIPLPIANVLKQFYESYVGAVKKNHGNAVTNFPVLDQYLDHVLDQLSDPFIFEPYHKKITSPIDYYQFGIDFIKPLVIFPKSTITGEQIIDEIAEKLAAKDNVILLANHQIEADPQAIALLLEEKHGSVGKNMIFVAGHKVVTDPLTVPFSKGCDLLCIYSKNYIQFPPELQHEKQLHNQRTMNKMRELLAEGGKCIYVAPSGGRDRPDASGNVDVAKFDGQSIEMFWLMAKKSGHPTHFYPLALSTYNLLPPPENVQKELGEQRVTNSTPIHLGFGDCLNMLNYPGSDHESKEERRKLRAEYIWVIVRDLYQNFPR
jgi:glycerol-3-phosphate O-acyltransferase